MGKRTGSGICPKKFTSTGLSAGSIQKKLLEFDTFIPSDILIQKTEGYILEAPKVEREDGKEEFAGPSMDNKS